MENNKFIRLQDFDGTTDLHICLDSVECVFTSEYDHIGCKGSGSYNYIKLKTGQIFETKESPNEIRTKIDPDYLFVQKEKARMVDSDGKTHIFS